jgi:hypothetical protein
MARAAAKILNFIEREEARLAIASVDRTKWIRLMANPGPGETAESAIAKHLAEHPEDYEQVAWMQWLWKPAAAPPAAVANPTPVAVEKQPAASPAPEPKKPELRPDLEPEPIVPWGFGRRKTYNALTDDYE